MSTNTTIGPNVLFPPEDKPDDEDASIDSLDEETEEEVEEKTKENKQSTKLSPYHAQNYFNSTMGGKDLCVLFSMVVSCSSPEFPYHKDPPFLKSKATIPKSSQTQQH